MTEHVITEKDVTFTEFHLEYDPEIKDLQQTSTSICESLSMYDREISCSCGVEFDGFEDARTHAAKHTDTIEK